ncbi:MAG TPA: DUF1501 domain-containing protein, partial [Planctomycetaceae bacterium]|nr:DUF1501 domain-containing protein [Planctomycetaceae bacterium]
MLRFVSEQPGARGRLSRREWLRVGGLSALGLLGKTQRPRPARADVAGERLPGFGRAKSVIVVFASGGQSQLDTWDPKPEAPREVRG